MRADGVLGSVTPRCARWHVFSWQQLMGYVAITVVALFFVTGPIFMATHVNFGNLPFVLMISQLVLHVLFIRKLNLRYLTLACAYICMLLFSLCVTPVFGIPIKYGIMEMLYYMKPLFFFILGYCFLNKSKLDRFYLFLLVYMVAGTICFYTDPMLFIKETLLKIGDVEQQNKGFLYAFSLFIRNTSFLLSALETSFVMFFISFHYYYQFWNRSSLKNFILMSISLLLLISAIARSSILGLLLAVGIHMFIVARPLRRMTLICGMCMLSILFFLTFQTQIEFLLFKDHSASVHHENLGTALSHITSSFFLPSGLGSSGWVTAGMPFNIYSEGSIFTSIIENGILFVSVYGGALYLSFKSSKDYLLPIFIGYLLASLLIPIGFSTLFNLLFFSALGVSLRKPLSEMEGTVRYPDGRLSQKDVLHA